MKKQDDQGPTSEPGKKHPFQGFSDREKSELYRVAKIKKLEQSEFLIREGETDQTAYVILDGLLRVQKNIQGRDVEVAALGGGDWVGEIAFTQRIPRTASAIAVIPSTVMVIDQATLDTLDPQTQVALYRRLNDLAAQRVSELSTREMELADRNHRLVNYIFSSRNRDKLDYLNSDMIRHIIKKVPPLPGFASRLVSKLLEENVSPGDVAELIKEDDSLNRLVLKIVNSSLYGLDQKVSDIHHAVMTLGFHEVYQLVISEGLRRTMPDTTDYRRLHEHCVHMSHVCFQIALSSGLGQPTEAAAIGLLHDLGRSVVQLLQDKNPHLATLIAGLDHAHLGGMLIREWDLPPQAYSPIEFQGYPFFSPPELIPGEILETVTILYLAHLIIDLLEKPGQPVDTGAFGKSYLALTGWADLELEDVLKLKLLPELKKRVGVYPVSFRTLLESHEARLSSAKQNK